LLLQQDWGNLEAWEVLNLVQQNLEVIWLDKLESAKMQ
jgi:hypothetical protein